jgi:hypothetical protein
MEPLRIDELARRLLESLPSGMRTLQADAEANFRAVLRSNLARLDLLTRDEFDAQSRVLERTRSRLAALEARVTELERALAATPPSGAQDSGAS